MATDTSWKFTDGVPLIFGINPRFGSSLAPTLAGFISYLTPAPGRILLTPRDGRRK